MKSKVFLITLEDSETRYTSQWKRWIRNDLSNIGIEYQEIDGDTQTTITGENFLNPNTTNIYKSEQIIKLAKLFEEKKVEKNNVFFFYDAWHYGVIALHYMSVLNNIPIKIFGAFHAGSYDPYDLLGQKDTGSLLSFERSLVEILDKSFVATNFHKNMMLHNLNLAYYLNLKIIVTGFPYNFDELDKYIINNSEKENIVVFPHRISKEKNPDILRNLEKDINGKVVFCQEKQLSKEDYHILLAKSKVVFSANDQETWGLGVFEAMYLGNIPVIPDRLSYREMYFQEFKYGDDSNLAEIINERFDNYSKYTKYIKNNINHE